MRSIRLSLFAWLLAAFVCLGAGACGEDELGPPAPPVEEEDSGPAEDDATVEEDAGDVDSGGVDVDSGPAEVDSGGGTCAMEGASCAGGVACCAAGGPMLTCCPAMTCERRCP